MEVNKNPKPIFRYRSSSINNLYDLMNETITGSPIWSFNDEFDSIGSIDMNGVNKAHEILEKYIDKNSKGDKLLQNKRLIPFEPRDTRKIFKNLRIACFSKTNNNTVMWSHYSEKGKGFCFEYDLKDIQKIEADDNKKQWRERYFYDKTKSEDYIPFKIFNKDKTIYKKTIFKKVNYKETKTSMTEEVLWNILDNNNISISKFIQDNSNETNNYMDLIAGNMKLNHKFLFEKSKNWKYENEWRLVNTRVFSNRKSQIYNDEYVVIGKAKVKNVYLGTETTKQTENIILKICANKNIGVYRMINDYSSTNYGLKCEKLTKIIDQE